MVYTCRMRLFLKKLMSLRLSWGVEPDEFAEGVADDGDPWGIFEALDKIEARMVEVERLYNTHRKRVERSERAEDVTEEEIAALGTTSPGNGKRLPNPWLDGG